MKVTEKNLADRCSYIYCRDGQGAVIDFITELAGDCNPVVNDVRWHRCEACETESPFFKGDCLVCGSPYQKPSSNIEGHFMKSQLSKSQDIKLMIIENYIDYYTSEEAERIVMKENALLYVQEDHVDEIESFRDELIKEVLKSVSSFKL